MNNDIIIYASEYYQNLLWSNPENELAKYINSRNLSKKTMLEFGLGISPNGNGLAEYLTEKGYTTDDMIKFGLVNKEELYDTQANRVTFEVTDYKGNPIAFGGRVIDTTKRAKYKNTCNTPLFLKKNTVFNLYKASKHIDYSNPFLILVEGYIDCMTLWDNGIKNVVCTMGTSCTREQAIMIKMFTPKIVVIYDGDNAGKLATTRAKDIFKSIGVDTICLTLPDNLDPDEYINKYGKDCFITQVKKIVSKNKKSFI